MSVKIMTAVWAVVLPHAEKLVLLALADNANDEGECFPSLTTLSEKCCVHRTTILRCLRSLEEQRHITRTQRPQQRTLYHVHPVQCAPRSNVHLDAGRYKGRCTEHLEVGAQSDSARCTERPITIIEPSVKPSVEPSTRAREEPGPAERVFDHWRQTHRHPHAKLDGKRRKLLTAALANYSEADLCESISGYLNSPHHMGQNERATVYDDIELFLRDAKHIDAGLKFARAPPRTDLSPLTRRNVAAIADWQPPEMRNAAK